MEGLRNYVALLLFTVSTLRLAGAYVASQSPLRIDCGSSQSSVDANGLAWQADAFFTNGTAKEIQTEYTTGGGLSLVDRTVRFWRSGDSCYRVPVAPGRYLVRLSFAYDNVDDNYFNLLPLNQQPSVGVSINEFFVEQVAAPRLNASAYLTDYIAFSQPQPQGDGQQGVWGAAGPWKGGAGSSASDAHVLTVCLLPVVGNPYVNSLQVLPVDTASYFAASTGPSVVLSSWARINAGGPSLGPETRGDPGFRTWQADGRPGPAAGWRAASSTARVSVGAQWAPLNLPPALFQTAREASGPLRTTGFNFTGIFPVDPGNRFLVLLYFAEIDAGAQEGERAMDVWVNGRWASIDILARAGAPHTALVFSLSDVALAGAPRSPEGQWLAVLLRPAAGAVLPPLVSGVEVYELIFSTPQAHRGAPIRIDCGGAYNFTDEFGFSWSADYGFSSGAAAIVPAPGSSLELGRSMRVFPQGPENCYSLPVPNGRYAVRMLFDYGNYDGLNAPPVFGIGVERAPLVAVQPSTPGAFQDALATVTDGQADVCLYSKAFSPSPPIINSLEILPVDNQSYAAASLGPGAVLYSFYRLTLGGAAFGEGLTPGQELGHRQWADVSSTGVHLECSPACRQLSAPASSKVRGAAMAPEFLPLRLLQAARAADAGEGQPGAGQPSNDAAAAASLTLTLDSINAGVELLLFLHLVELRPEVRPGECVFSVFVNGEEQPTASRVDVAGQVGTFSLLTLQLRLPGGLPGNATTMQLRLQAVPGSKYGPEAAGVELYGVMHKRAGVPAQTVAALQAVASALQLPESLGWQGDPCSPLVWPGLNCTQLDSSTAQVTSINLSGLNLNGTLPPELATVGSLVQLNLSHNNLQGPIPPELATLAQLSTLDLSFNNLNGSIPAALAGMPSLRLLLLNNNDLRDLPPALQQPPASLAVDLAGNPSLCGSSGLPSCPAFSGPLPSSAVPLTPGATPSSAGGLSGGAVAGLVLGCLALAVLLGAAGVWLWRRWGAAEDFPDHLSGTSELVQHRARFLLPRDPAQHYQGLGEPSAEEGRQAGEGGRH